MNTRILRMCERLPIGNCRIVRGLGQLQPTLFSVERPGRLTFRAESVADRYGAMQPCWMILPLPYQKRAAKALFAELELCSSAGAETRATQCWRERKAAYERATVAALSAANLSPAQSDLFAA